MSGSLDVTKMNMFCFVSFVCFVFFSAKKEKHKFARVFFFSSKLFFQTPENFLQDIFSLLSLVAGHE